MLRVVQVQIAWLLIESEEERVRRSLARAVHIRNIVRTESLSPIVPARCCSCVDEREALAAVGTSTFFIEVDRDVRHARLPAELQQECWIIERPGRGVNHVAADAAVLTRFEGLLAELHKLVLSGKTLPSIRSDIGRIDTSRGSTVEAVTCAAICRIAIFRSREPQVIGKREVFFSTRQQVADR